MPNSLPKQQAPEHSVTDSRLPRNHIGMSICNRLVSIPPHAKKKVVFGLSLWGAFAQNNPHGLTGGMSQSLLK